MHAAALLVVLSPLLRHSAACSLRRIPAARLTWRLPLPLLTPWQPATHLLPICAYETTSLLHHCHTQIVREHAPHPHARRSSLSISLIPATSLALRNGDLPSWEVTAPASFLNQSQIYATACGGWALTCSSGSESQSGDGGLVITPYKSRPRRCSASLSPQHLLIALAHITAQSNLVASCTSKCRPTERCPCARLRGGLYFSVNSMIYALSPPPLLPLALTIQVDSAVSRCERSQRHHIHMAGAPLTHSFPWHAPRLRSVSPASEPPHSGVGSRKAAESSSKDVMALAEGEMGRRVGVG